MTATSWRGQRTELVNKAVRKVKGRYELAVNSASDLALAAPSVEEEVRKWASGLAHHPGQPDVLRVERAAGESGAGREAAAALLL